MSQTVNEALVAILDADAGVQALAGTPPRISPILAPEDTPTPFIVYARAGGQDVTSTTGPSGLRQTTFDFAAWSTADDPDKALALANAVRDALNSHDGYQAAAAAGNVRLNSALMVGESDEYDDVRGLVAVVYTFEVWYNDPAA
jgi:hypothetical protein